MGALEKLFVGMQFAVLAGVVQRDVGVSSFIAVVDFAHIERLGIDVDADSALLKFGQIQNLVNRFERIHVGRMRRIHFVRVGGSEVTGVFRGVVLLDAEILYFQAADRCRHPTILVAMIVDAAELADFPADGHTFEHIVLENQVAGVTAFGKEKVFLERFGTDGVVENVVLNSFQGEVAVGDGGEIFDPIGDVELFDGELFGHGKASDFSSGFVSMNLFASGPVSTSPETLNPKEESITLSAIMGAVAGKGEGMELLGKSREELRALCVTMGEPAYRGDQLYRALYADRISDLSRVTNLPAAFRERLASDTTVTLPMVRQRYSSMDGSVRYLLGLGEKQDFTTKNAENTKKKKRPASVEAVFMPSEARQTICISTQAGCAVDCQFCMTAQLGLIRNLTAGEILAQVLLPLQEHKETLTPQTNVVLMGQGEPLLNYENVMAAMRILLDQSGIGLAPKHVTLSTSGIVPGIERLAKETRRPKLAISLNASSDAQRDVLMPINKKYPLRKLLAACRDFPRGSREYITFEYVLLGGVNDTLDDAKRVARLMADLGRVKVNLIPWNPGSLPYQEPCAGSIERFHKVLLEKGIPAFTRYSRGRDVMAACGQLSLNEVTSNQFTVRS